MVWRQKKAPAQKSSLSQRSSINTRHPTLSEHMHLLVIRSDAQRIECSTPDDLHVPRSPAEDRPLMDVPPKKPPEWDVTYVGMANALPSPRAAEGDLVQQRHIVPDNSRLSNDNASGMIHQDPPAHLCGWMDVHVEHLRHSALEQHCQLLLHMTARGLNPETQTWHTW